MSNIYEVYVLGIDVNKKLLDDLSLADISVSFSPPMPQTQNFSTWYRCAFIIDLSCGNSKEILEQVIFPDKSDHIC